MIDVTIQSFSTTDQYDLTFDVIITANSNPVTNLVIGDFSIADSFSGTVPITGFTNNGSGNYTLETSLVLTNGTLTVLNAVYSGADTYNVGTAKTAVTISSITSDDYLEIEFYVEETISGTPVTGLLTGDIEIDDDIGLADPLIQDSFTDYGDGNYKIVLNEIITVGDITIDNASYSGTESYALRSMQIDYHENMESFSGSGYEEYPDGWTLTSNNSFGANNQSVQVGGIAINHILQESIVNWQKNISPKEFAQSDVYYILFRYKTNHSISSSYAYFTYGAYKTGSSQEISMWLADSTNYISKVLTFSTALTGANFGYYLIELAGASAYDIDLTIDEIIIYKFL